MVALDRIRPRLGRRIEPGPDPADATSHLSEDRRRFGWVDRGGEEEGRAAVVGMFDMGNDGVGRRRRVSGLEG